MCHCSGGDEDRSTRLWVGLSGIGGEGELEVRCLLVLDLLERGAGGGLYSRQVRGGLNGEIEGEDIGQISCDK